MKTTSFAAAAIVACASLVAAVPTTEPSAEAAGWDTYGNAPPKKCKKKGNPFSFTSTYRVIAVQAEVIATDQTPAPGQPGAVGYYNFGINSALDTICYNITLVGVEGNYQSPANTATHIHEAPRGRAGPPRIAFPNPVTDASDPNIRRSVGCLTGPFVTGVVNNGTDSGAGFTVSQIENQPEQFFADVHTDLFVPGAVRGQLD